jgi:Fe-S cluster biogenesis protein NfuA
MIMNKSALFIVSIILSAFTFSCARNHIYFGDDNLPVLHEKTFQISPGKVLELNTSGGNVEITTWDKNEVYVKIFGNERAKSKVNFTFNNNGDKVEVTAKAKNSFWSFGNSGIKMKFEVKVPSNFNPSINTSGGNIKLTDLAGNPDLRTSGGNIYVQNTTGNIRTNTSGGEIKAERIAGNTKLSTSGGNISVTDFTGDLDVNTSGGNIHLQGSDSKIYAETSGGNIKLDYTGKNNGIDLRTSGGDIVVDLPSDFNASALLSTSGGHVSCNFAANKAVKISSSKFEADLNNGGNQFIAKTSGGDIKVSKK